MEGIAATPTFQPVGVTTDKLADEVVAEIGEQDPQDDVELEEADHEPAALRRNDFRDVHRRQHRSAADSDTKRQPREAEYVDVGGKGATNGGEREQESDDLKRISPAEPVADEPGHERADARAKEGNGDGKPKSRIAQMKHGPERGSDARDDGGIEAEKQTRQRRHGDRKDVRRFIATPSPFGMGFLFLTKKCRYCAFVNPLFPAFPGYEKTLFERFGLAGRF